MINPFKKLGDILTPWRTPAQTEDAFDGCGVTPFTTSKKEDFQTACSWHDSAYLDKSIWQSKYTRKQVDDQFLLQMLHIAGDSTLLQLRAHIYYKIARIFGSRFWEGRE